MVVEGVKTNISLHQKLIMQKDMKAGDHPIEWLEAREG